MNDILTALHCIAGAIILAEALNKLERTDPLAPGLCVRQRLVVFLKVTGWALLAIGAGGALVTPMMGMPAPGLGDTATMLGFAVLVVRTRVRETVRTEAERSA